MTMKILKTGMLLLNMFSLFLHDLPDPEQNDCAGFTNQ
jgi:hypothetical protein